MADLTPKYPEEFDKVADALNNTHTAITKTLTDPALANLLIHLSLVYLREIRELRDRVAYLESVTSHLPDKR